jgi:hypothetical protein
MTIRKVLLLDLTTDYLAQSKVDKKLKFAYLQKKPKLGLQYLCSAIEDAGICCEIMDQLVMPFSIKELLAKIKREKFIFVGFYSHFLIREKNNPICEGNHDLISADIFR